MAEVHMVSGIAGSGKSHIATTLVNQMGAVYVSSDKIREKWYGDAAIQGDSSAVFTEVRVQVRAALRNNKPVVYDATNLTRRRRIHFIRNDVRGFPVTAHVACPSVSVCLERNKNRARRVKEEVIKQMYKRFELPFKEEGFADVHYYTDHHSQMKEKEELEKLLKTTWSHQELVDSFQFLEGFASIIDLPHDTHRHHFSVSRHTFHTLLEVRKVYDGNPPPELLWTSVLHDLGKGETKSFLRFNGEERKYAGYEGHENVGAYLAIRNLYLAGYEDDFARSVAKLIQFHHLHQGSSKKSRKQAGMIMTPEEQTMLSVFQSCNDRTD